MTVGIDIGTTSVKAVAVDAGGRVRARARVANAMLVPSPVRLEHDAASAWWDAPRQVLESVLRQLGSPAGSPAASGPEGGRHGAGGQLAPVVAVAVSAMAPSLAPVDASGRPIGPGILYGDERASATGLDPTRSDEATSLLAWCARAHPEAFGYWPAQAVANRSLGGAATVDLSTAMTAGVLLGGDGWDVERCQAAGVAAAQLPAIEMFGRPIGEVATGLRAEQSEAITLVAGGVDALCEQLVVGRLEVGDVLVVCGSTLVVWVVTENPIITQNPIVTQNPVVTENPVFGGAGSSLPEREGLWTLPDLTPGRSMVGGPSNAGGLFLDWIDRLVRPGGGRPINPAVIPVWQPYVRGERVPFHDPTLRSSVTGLDLTQGPDAVRRGAYEASAMALRHIVERAGGRPSRIVATGGGTRVPGWLQAIADVTGTPVQPAGIAEGAALGAAWLARLGVGLERSTEEAARWATFGTTVEPDPAWIGPCEARYQRYLQGR